jgi:hypothetical protein
LLGDGHPQEVEIWSTGLRGIRPVGQRLVNAARARAWREGADCVWRENGVWDVGGDGQPRLLRPKHFVEVEGRARSRNGGVNFADDYLRPFLVRYARAIRALDPDALIFLEAPPQYAPPHWDLAEVPDVVHAAHWYDGLTLFTKRYIPFLGIDHETGRFTIGRKRVRRSFAAQLARLKAEAAERLNGVPTLVGEFGIPFDLQGKRAYDTGDFGPQVQAMDDTFQALEANLLSGTLWNYTPDNDNRWGDQWNDEDLSIFSPDQQIDPDDLNSGGRALEAVVRPYASKVAGEPLEMTFDLKRRTFEFTFRHDASVEAPTVVYVPNLQYPDGYRVEVSDGSYETDPKAQRLTYHHSPERAIHRICVRPGR